VSGEGERAPAEVEADRLEWLAPERLSFRWGGGPGPIHLTIAGDRTLLRVEAVAAFPRAAPGRFVELSAGGEPAGVLRDAAALGPDDRAALAELLRRGRPVPRVTRIVAVEERGHLVRWELETDRGPCALDMDRPYAQVRRLEGGGVVLKDLGGDRYEVPDEAALDARSRDLLGRFA